MARSSFCRLTSPQVLSILAAAAALVLLAPSAGAHPGHGVTPAGDHVAHYLLEPAHGLGIVVLVVLAVAVFAVLRARATGRSRAAATEQR